MDAKEYNNGLLETLNTIIPLFEELMSFTNDWTAEKYMKTIKVAMEKKYNAFSICLVFDLMLASFLKECRITLVDLVLERDKEAVDCVAISKCILNELKQSGYYDLKEKAFDKMQKFLDETYRKGTKIDTFFAKGENLYNIIEFHFKTIDDMELHQFIKGNENNEKPLYLKHINCFRSMDEAIQVMKKIPVNFIALVGIKDKNSLEYGFFSYIIKNGASIYALSDVNRANGVDGTFTDRRSVYKDLMPYVHLGEFQYVWWWMDLAGNLHPLNTDKYHVALNNKNWNTFTLNELEDDEILLQYFMFDYVSNLLFKEKPTVKELTYTSQTVALMYKGKTINKKQLPLIYNDLNTTDMELPNLMLLLDEVEDELYKKYIDNAERWKIAEENGQSTFFLVDCSKIAWEVKLLAIDRIRNVLRKKPLEMMLFEYDRENVINILGSKQNLAKEQEDKVYGLSNHFFGTKHQYEQYSKGVLKGNLLRLIEMEYRKIIKEEKKPQYVRFLTYLVSSKFKDLIIEKCLLEALTKKRFSRIIERKYTKPTWSCGNGSWEVTGDNIWNNQLTWREREESKGCILTGIKSCSYKVSLRLTNLEHMKVIWEFLNVGNVPDFMRINRYNVKTHNLDFDDWQVAKIFGNGNSEIFWISKRGLKEFCKKHNLNYEQSLLAVETNNE